MDNLAISVLRVRYLNAFCRALAERDGARWRDLPDPRGLAVAPSGIARSRTRWTRSRSCFASPKARRPASAATCMRAAPSTATERVRLPALLRWLALSHDQVPVDREVLQDLHFPVRPGDLQPIDGLRLADLRQGVPEAEGDVQLRGAHVLRVDEVEPLRDRRQRCLELPEDQVGVRQVVQAPGEAEEVLVLAGQGPEPAWTETLE